MKIKLFTTAALVLFAMALVPLTSWAQVTGQCADCHTMHNSQDGAAMAMEWDSTYSNLSSSSTPFPKLLIRSGCLGCHAGTRTAGTDMLDNAAKVLAASAPTYTLTSPAVTSAGGNFWWVKTTDATGHNVAGIAGVDVALSYQPPGFDVSYTSSTHGGVRNSAGGATWSTQLTCAGTNGCHGTAAAADDFTAISGAHHGADATIDGLTCATSYRFLNGIIGLEDDDWEHTFSATDHNQYHGEDRTNATTQSDTSTISYLCCECHGVFHDAASASGTYSPWLRHPTDFDMGNVASDLDKEYQFYNEGAGAGAAAPYSTTAPVASDQGSVSGVQQTVFNVGDDAIVTCISCHRAHGSPYDDLLRWQYNEGDASDIHAGGTGATGNVGCFICHTTKDDS